MVCMEIASNLTDDDLAARALGPAPDDRQALGELLRRHSDALLGFFMVHFRDLSLAEDLVQDVFVRVIRSRRSFGPPFRFRPWLWTIAHNVARRAHRPRGADREIQSLESVGPVEGGPMRESLVDTAPSPRQRAAQGQRLESLWRAIDRLDEGQRDVVVLKGIQGLKCGEVAQVLGISEGTVWSRFHRALGGLRGMLRSEVDEP
jgi:RNA polymerase sigma-70 factor (ECF subfamily)